MELTDFAVMVPGFTVMTHMERIKHLGWFLHVHRGRERFAPTNIKDCYDQLHLEKPQNFASLLNSLAERNPKVVLKDSKGFRLEIRVRQELDAKYGTRPASIAIEKALAQLPNLLTDETKRKYLVEALDCYRVKAFRAAIVMTWNLAYDHLLNWILMDPARLATFNSEIPIQFPRKAGFTVTSRECFEELRESQVVQIAAARLFTKNVKKILEDKLDKRNMSAHPATIEVTQYQAEDTISDLVNNVILKLS